VNSPDGFNVLWQYFGWSNQTLTVFTLWAMTVYLRRRGGRGYWITLIPALFMTAVCITFAITSPLMLGLG
jgi:carbon starvation protein CstA